MPRITSKEIKIQSKLLCWYKKNKRILPWRKLHNKKLPNPYYVLVSEFMLQQTTVNAVVSRFKEFIKIWPNLKKLSMINENQILQFWSGLGYYARAKNLLNSAKIISLKFNNIVPDNYNDLIDLPGVGDYTANILLALIYNQPRIALDGNVKRVLSRLFNINLKNVANLFKTKRNADLAEAFMEFGALICKPVDPKCNECEKYKILCYTQICLRTCLTWLAA